ELFLADSQHTAGDLKILAVIPQEKLEVILAGVNDKFSEDLSPAKIDTLLWKHQLQRDNFLLFIGVPDQRKNSRGMFSGLEIARRSLKKDLRLVIAGDIPDFLIQDLRRLQQKLEIPQEAVMFTGYVTDEELTALYKSAFALLFPSLYEGFGFPIVEAMKAGLPVIAGRNSSQVEVSGDAAILVDALNNEEIARAIVELYSNPGLRRELSDKGKIHCRQYTWEKVAAKTAQYLLQYFGNKKGVRSNA
ncbi:MAG: glycosyltransferase family 4 protein, partial [FCB group bacterium]|nr:glycosyltransferase family 4 protein [FCB group bacterium]